jgi:L-seryl-tRNA(Ser) seleniumtransferase
MKRRDLLKNLSIVPLAGTVAGTLLPFESTIAAPRSKKRNLFKELGVRTFINAAGTYTFMTGSLMHDEVVDAIRLHHMNFVCLMNCRIKWGKKLRQ